MRSFAANGFNIVFGEADPPWKLPPAYCRGSAAPECNSQLKARLSAAGRTRPGERAVLRVAPKPWRRRINSQPFSLPDPHPFVRRNKQFVARLNLEYVVPCIDVA